MLLLWYSSVNNFTCEVNFEYCSSIHVAIYQFDLIYITTHSLSGNNMSEITPSWFAFYKDKQQYLNIARF